MSNKWTVDKTAVERVVKLLSLVPAKNGIMSSEFVKISKSANGTAILRLNSELSAKIGLKSDEPFPFDTLFLDRRVFFPFVQNGKESKAELYDFFANDSRLLIKHGSRKAGYVKPNEVAGYEDFPKVDYSTLEITKKWAQVVRCASTCATNDPITPTLNCIYLRQQESYLEIFATNQIIVFAAKAKIDHKLKTDIAFPLSLVEVLVQDNAKTLQWSNKLAIVNFGLGKIWAPVKSRARTGFPVKIIENLRRKALKSNVVCEINSVGFSKAIDRLSAYVAPLGFGDMVLNLNITKGEKRIILTSGTQHNKFSETVFAIKEPTVNMTIEWPFEKVLPAILYSKDAGSVRIHVDEEGQSAFATSEISMIIARSE